MSEPTPGEQWPPPPPPAYDPTQPYPQGYPALPYGYVSATTEHPQAKTALVLGLVSLVGAFFCVLPILVSPFAWVVGFQSRRAIRREPQRYSGEGTATAGMVLGIVGTVLLALGILAIVLLFAFADGSGTSTGFDTGNV